MTEEAQENKFLYTNGRYLAKCTNDHGATTFGNPDKPPRYYIYFQLLEGPDKGKRIVETYALSGAGLEFTKKVLKTCGYDPSCGKLPSECVLDKEVFLVIEDDTYQGKTRSRVKYVNDPNYTGNSKLSENKLDAKQSAVLLGDLVAAWRSEEKSSASPQTKATAYAPPTIASRGAPKHSNGKAAAQQEDDDIPF